MTSRFSDPASFFLKAALQDRMDACGIIIQLFRGHHRHGSLVVEYRQHIAAGKAAGCISSIHQCQYLV